MVCFPYPKRMCANIDVDQGAAVLLCSYEAAQAAGVPDDRMVFLHAAAEAHDHYFFSERWTLTDSPGIATTVGDALAAAGIGLDDVARFDLYSCFPSAVQVAMRALALADDDPRPLTVTGGLGFAGGPVNNYPTHAIARMVEVLRARSRRRSGARPRSAGTSRSTRPASGRRRRPRTDSVAPITRRARRRSTRSRAAEPAGLVDGAVTLEATSVAVERDGTPSLGIVTALTAAGERVMANIRDHDALDRAHARGARGPDRPRHQRRQDEHVRL